MKKIFIIGGGIEASNYTDYETYLKNETFDPYFIKEKYWKDNLGLDLWGDYEVIKIPMPNAHFAEYRYWKIMFEKALPYFWEKNILLGHSLWGSFLLKYLSENTLDTISQIHLVAPAVFDTPEEKIGSFHFDTEWKNYQKFESQTYVYFSKDDTIVPFENAIHLQKVLPNAHFEIFDDKGHFIFLEHFEELVKNIIS